MKRNLIIALTFIVLIIISVIINMILFNKNFKIGKVPVKNHILKM